MSYLDQDLPLLIIKGAGRLIINEQKQLIDNG